ncbi:Zinc finger C2H2 type family protein [Acanthocheilonema viteae]
MLLPYYFAVFVLASCIAQVTVSNGGDLPMQAELRNDGGMTATADNNERNRIKFECEQCQLTRKHIRIKHIRRCGICHKSFTQPATLWRHGRTHNKGKPLKCNKCGKKYIRGSYLKKHAKWHESENIGVKKWLKKSDILTISEQLRLAKDIGYFDEEII